MKYSKQRFHGSDCHVIVFNPDEYRLDTTIGKHMVLERLSQMNGEPNDDEYTIAKINGGFFDMKGSTEFIGSYVDGRLFYQGANPTYPTMYFDKNNVLKVDIKPDLKRHAWYQSNAHWAMACPWTLVLNGKADFTYSEAELVRWYGHPKSRHPRTMLGQKANKDIVLVVVDGRTGWNRGVNMYHQADIMLKLGCVTAFNLDGGGSSEMIYKNEIMNRPSDNGHERRIGTAFMVYAKKELPKKGGSTKKPPQGAMSLQGIVTAHALNVRDQPGVSGKKVGLVYRNERVEIIDIDQATGWYKLVLSNGVSGYSSNNYIQLV